MIRHRRRKKWTWAKKIKTNCIRKQCVRLSIWSWLGWYWVSLTGFVLIIGTSSCSMKTQVDVISRLLSICAIWFFVSLGSLTPAPSTRKIRLCHLMSRSTSASNNRLTTRLMIETQSQPFKTSPTMSDATKPCKISTSTTSSPSQTSAVSCRTFNTN